MASLVDNLAGTLAALAAVERSAGLARAHLYFECASERDMDDAAGRLAEAGFAQVRRRSRRHDYKLGESVLEEELALGSVGVYLRLAP